MPTTQSITVQSLIDRHAADVAFVAEEEPAATVAAFVRQLGIAAEYLIETGLDDDGLTETAAAYLADAATAEGAEQQVLLKQASERLFRVADMAREYRDMV